MFAYFPTTISKGGVERYAAHPFCILWQILRNRHPPPENEIRESEHLSSGLRSLGARHSLAFKIAIPLPPGMTSQDPRDGMRVVVMTELYEATSYVRDMGTSILTSKVLQAIHP